MRHMCRSVALFIFVPPSLAGAAEAPEIHWAFQKPTRAEAFAKDESTTRNSPIYSKAATGNLPMPAARTTWLRD